MRLPVLCFAALSVLLVPSTAPAQQVNTTDGTSQWEDDALQYNANRLRYKGWGQVFEAPTAAEFLTSFSFWMRQRDDMGNSLFRAHLATWDDANNTFSDVWVSGNRNVTSPLVSSSSAGPLSDFGEQSFAPRIQVTAGQTYLAYLEVSHVLDYVGVRSGDRVAMRWNQADGTTGLVKIVNGQYANKWDTWDAAFTANFVTPEPSTIFLLGTGLLGLGGMAWVRRRKHT